MAGGVIENNAPANAFSGWLARIETGLIAVSAAAMSMIMCIVVVDVAMRYAFAAPLVWSYDFIGYYLVGAVFFLALPDTLQRHGHIELDVFVPMIPVRLRHMLQSVGYAVSTALVVAITWLAFLQLKDAFLADARISVMVPWPTWIAHAVLTIGMGVLCIRCGYRAVLHFFSAMVGRALVELPPPPATDRSSGWSTE